MKISFSISKKKGTAWESFQIQGENLNDGETVEKKSKGKSTHFLPSTTRVLSKDQHARNVSAFIKNCIRNWVNFGGNRKNIKDEKCYSDSLIEGNQLFTRAEIKNGHLILTWTQK